MGTGFLLTRAKVDNKETWATETGFNLSIAGYPQIPGTNVP